MNAAQCPFKLSLVAPSNFRTLPLQVLFRLLLLHFWVLLLNLLSVWFCSLVSEIGLLGDLFDMLLPMLGIYQEYVRNHHYSLQVLTECKQQPEFVQLLKRLEMKPACQGRSLEMFLTFPMHQVSGNWKQMRLAEIRGMANAKLVYLLSVTVVKWSEYILTINWHLRLSEKNIIVWVVSCRFRSNEYSSLKVLIELSKLSFYNKYGLSCF